MELIKDAGQHGVSNLNNYKLISPYMGFKKYELKKNSRFFFKNRRRIIMDQIIISMESDGNVRMKMVKTKQYE